MSMPFYVAPEQVMKDRADYARKGIARGRSLVAVVYDDGILICAENPSNTLRKVSEIYDRIAFAGVGKYNEFDQLRIAGVRHADLKGYSLQPRGRRRPQPGQPVRPDPRPDLHPRDEADGGRDPRGRGRRRRRATTSCSTSSTTAPSSTRTGFSRARRRGRGHRRPLSGVARRADLRRAPRRRRRSPDPTGPRPPTSRSPCSPDHGRRAFRRLEPRLRRGWRRLADRGGQRRWRRR